MMNEYSGEMETRNLIDLFCGAGGLSLGFSQAGFDVLIGNDIDAVAGKTFAATHPGSKFFHAPVEEVDARTLLSLAGLSKGQLFCLAGGPPCQAFSVYNHNRGMHDERSQLFRQYLRLVDGLRPKWLVMENVTGILSIAGGEAVTAIKSGLEELGYRVIFGVLKAEEFGVPQERRRVVFIATNSSVDLKLPSPTHGLGKRPFVNIRSAISDLPVLVNGGGGEVQNYRYAPKSDFQIDLRSESDCVLNHTSPRLSQINMERLKHIPPGGSWRDIPFDLLPDGMKKAKRSDHTKRYGRLSWEGLSSTILTKCDVHWGAFIHPSQQRAISVREAARIQSFPDSFCFHGSQTEQFKQIGNAVPPLLGKAIALSILRAEADYNRSFFSPVSSESVAA